MDDAHLLTEDDRFLGEEVFEVDRILAKKVVNAPGRLRRDGSRKTIIRYLIHWKNQSAWRDWLVNEEDCLGCAEAMQDFERREASRQAPAPAPSN